MFLLDTYNTLKTEFISTWDEACEELGIKLTIEKSLMFTPLRIFFDEFLYVSAIGSQSMAIINFKELLLELFGRDIYEKYLPLVKSLTRS